MGFLSTEQRLFFESDGYLIVEDALTGAEVEAVRRACDEAESRWRADPELPGEREPEFIEIAGILEYHPVFLDLAMHPRVFPLVRELVGSDIALIDHNYFITPPGGELDAWAWHRDTRTPGVYPPRSTMMVTTFFALEDIAPDGGATLVLPRSHHFTDEVAAPLIPSWFDYLVESRKLERPEEVPGAVPLSCRAGSAYFFNGNILHGPSHNRGPATRRMVLFTYGHKWMRMWEGHDPSQELRARAITPMQRQLLGLTEAYGGEDAELETGGGLGRRLSS